MKQLKYENLFETLRLCNGIKMASLQVMNTDIYLRAVSELEEQRQHLEIDFLRLLQDEEFIEKYLRFISIERCIKALAGEAMREK